MMEKIVRQALLEQHFLRGLTEGQISQLADRLKMSTYAPGEMLFRRGEPVAGLLIVVEGVVELLDDPSSGTPTRYEPGDTLGEAELAFELPWSASARAINQVSVLHWDPQRLDYFLTEHPAARQSLLLTASSRRMARKLRFAWLHDNEKIYGLVRKHPITVLPLLILPLVILGIGGWMGVSGYLAENQAPQWAGAAIFLIGSLFFAWQLIDWSNDYYILTNKRVIWLDRIIAFYDNRVETPLHMVISASVSTEILGRIIGYGDVIVRTYTGEIVFRQVADPHAMASLLDFHWRRSKARRSSEDLKSRQETIRGMLRSDEDTPVEDPAPELQVADPQVGLDRWSFEMRFEEDGVITYRKHWMLLLRRIWMPSTLILLLAAALGLRLSGSLTSPSVETFSILLGGLFLAASGWWLYEYADWINDVYQITKSQILDINRRPLAREVRKVAPLRNILATEVERQGLLGLLLNFGNVITNIGTEQFVFRGVYNPAAVQQEIARAINRLQEAEESEKRRQRRDEMVEWLSVYHQQASEHPDSEPLAE